MKYSVSVAFATFWSFLLMQKPTFVNFQDTTCFLCFFFEGSYFEKVECVGVYTTNTMTMTLRDFWGRKPGATHQSSQRVRGVPPPRTPHCQSGAAGQRLYPAQREQRGSGGGEKRRSRSETEDEERRRDSAKSWKTAGRIKPRRNSFAPWGHRCTGFRPLFCKGDMTRTRPSPVRQSTEHGIPLALLCFFPPESEMNANSVSVSIT